MLALSVREWMIRDVAIPTLILRKVESTRKYIFEQGRGVNSTAVNDILQEDSYIPTRVSPT